ncbi:MAG: acyl-CoA thioesterase [Erythrobacter sp.]
MTTNAPICITARVRFGDCDPAGIVFTPRYGGFVFEAAETWLEAVMGLSVHQQLNEGEIGTPVRSLTTDLHRSLRPGDRFTSTVYVEAIGRTSFRLLVIGRREDGVLSFVGRMTCVTTDPSHRSAMPLSEMYQQRLTQYQADCGDIPAIA